MYGMAQSWKRMMVLGALGVGSVGIAGAGAALMTPTGHAFVRGELAPGDTGVDDVSVEEWLATPIQSTPYWLKGNSAQAMASLKAYLRPELRQEFEFNGNTYWFLLVDSVGAAQRDPMLQLSGRIKEFDDLKYPAAKHIFVGPGLPPGADED